MHIVSMNWVLTQVHSVDILWELAGCHPYPPVLFCFAVDKGHHVPAPFNGLSYGDSRGLSSLISGQGGWQH